MFKALGCNKLMYPSPSRNDHASGLEFLNSVSTTPYIALYIRYSFPRGIRILHLMAPWFWTAHEWGLPTFPSEAFLFQALPFHSFFRYVNTFLQGAFKFPWSGSPVFLRWFSLPTYILFHSVDFTFFFVFGTTALTT